MNALKTYWKSLTANRQELDSSYYLLYDIIRGRDPKKSGFTQITNKTKLYSGQTAWGGLKYAKSKLRNRLRAKDPIFMMMDKLSGWNDGALDIAIQSLEI